MASRFFKYDKKLGKVVELTVGASENDSDAPLGFVKNRTANKRRSGSRMKWPTMCDSMGCMPDQVDEANANCRKMGRSDVSYHPDGTVELGSGRAMEWLAKQTDTHHRDGWF